MIVNVAVALAARLPRSAVTLPSAKAAVPWLAVTELNVTCYGRVSVTLTPEASERPVLVTTIL